MSLDHLTPAQRSLLARKAAVARWAKYRAEHPVRLTHSEQMKRYYYAKKAERAAQKAKADA